MSSGPVTPAAVSGASGSTVATVLTLFSVISGANYRGFIRQTQPPAQTRWLRDIQCRRAAVESQHGQISGWALVRRSTLNVHPHSYSGRCSTFLFSFSGFFREQQLGL